jgi:putative membrane protein
MLHSFLWWLLLILGIVVLVRLLRGGARGAGPPPETALDILKKRYARGEIGKTEFEEKKRDLAQ